MVRLSIYILVLVFGISPAAAQSADNREYQVKAVFLFNFTQFVEWPPQAFAEQASPFIIGILGKDPFDGFLEETIAAEKVNGHPLVIQHYKNIEEIKTCHILFIAQPEINATGEAMKNLNAKSILTVSDKIDFIQEGGIIRFITKDNKIQIQINAEAAKEANLIISSKLLRLAEVVSQDKKIS